MPELLGKPEPLIDLFLEVGLEPEYAALLQEQFVRGRSGGPRTYGDSSDHPSPLHRFRVGLGQSEDVAQRLLVVFTQRGRGVVDGSGCPVELPGAARVGQRRYVGASRMLNDLEEAALIQVVVEEESLAVQYRPGWDRAGL